jgi:hypothetical protein
METRESVLLERFEKAFTSALGFIYRNTQTHILSDIKGVDALMKFRVPENAIPLEIAVEIKLVLCTPATSFSQRHAQQVRGHHRIREVFLVAEMLQLG